MVRDSLKTGIAFGLTSGTITTLGLMVGLYSGTNSRLAVIGGILTIAIADSLSDALGMHISEESKNNTSQTEIWECTFATLFAKLFFASSFLIPVLILELPVAVMVSIAWGLLMLSVFSVYIARVNGDKPIHVVLEHVIIAVLVVFVTYYVGLFISARFG